jgi:squalene-hopene/tetraprenyl-beta-curcumene cyclase
VCVLVLIGWGAASFPEDRASAWAAEPITLANVQPPPPFAPDEPFAKEFSAALAARSLDTAALHWQKTRACTACHTMPAYLMARPALAAVSPPAPEVRQFFEDLVAQRRDALPSYLPADGRTAVRVGLATALAFNDRMTTGKLHPLTRKALDQLWVVQRPDGGWQWPFRDVPPIKITEHYGVTFAALGVGLAPDGYAQTEAARKGLERVRQYLKANPPASLHEKAMLLWASLHIDGLLNAQERANTLAELLAAQRPDGGWAMASLVDNTDGPRDQSDPARQARAERGYGTEFRTFLGRRGDVFKTALASDGYATGFVVYVARQAGVPATDERLRQGVDWLKTHQRVSGRWFTPSQGPHGQNLISNAGSAYAVLALHACGEIPDKTGKLRPERTKSSGTIPAGQPDASARVGRKSFPR